jgi:hypothetical protein
MLSILVVALTLGLLYGFIVGMDWAMKRWLPVSPIATPDVIAANAIIGGIEIDFAVSAPGIGSAIAAEMPVEMAAIGETVAPMVEASQEFLGHGASAIGDMLSGL